MLALLALLGGGLAVLYTQSRAAPRASGDGPERPFGSRRIDTRLTVRFERRLDGKGLDALLAEPGFELDGALFKAAVRSASAAGTVSGRKVREASCAKSRDGKGCWWWCCGEVATPSEDCERIYCEGASSP